MSKTEVLELFERWVGPILTELGFTGGGGHYVRPRQSLTQVIELQHSIYGGRVTANLGLDVPSLLPPIRWIAQPTIGPHAHDATRWIRIGMAMPERVDRWWSFTDEPVTIEEALRALGTAIQEHGLGWLERELDGAALLRFAEERLERSRSPIHPVGGFLELRLLAALHAQGGDLKKAQAYFQRAAGLWASERQRLENARRIYLEKNLPPGAPASPVPDLLGELEQVLLRGRPTSPTKASSKGPGALGAKPRKSRSGRSGSARA